MGFDLLLKGIAGATVLIAALWLGERGHHQLAGLAATFPALLVSSALLLGASAGREQMRGFASGALGGLVILGLFLGAYALALRNLDPLPALGVATLVWAIAAAAFIAFR